MGCRKSLPFVIDAFLSDLFNQFLLIGDVPDGWKIAHVIPIHKKGSEEEANNYRPVSLTSVVVKIKTGLKMKIGLNPRIVQWICCWLKDRGSIHFVDDKMSKGILPSK